MFATKAIISNQQLTTSAVAYYTAPEGTYTRLTQVTVTNQDVSPRTFDIYLVPTGASANATTKIINSKTLQPGESYVPYQILGAVLQPASAIYAAASTATQMSVYASGIELTF
jgi:hypothetical protein